MEEDEDEKYLSFWFGFWQNESHARMYACTVSKALRETLVASLQSVIYLDFAPREFAQPEKKNYINSNGN